ncbi:CE1759 family FMN reductase [Luteococcus peritonei]|uniref:CE1759 family FMN reductase n=1 Tax=Luteococcus peritonei TaxID=88874 RepID=A0ABW4RTZ1_9ACTN
MKIVAISAGLGLPSSASMLSERLAKASGADQIQVIELRDLAHDLVNALLTRVNSPAVTRAVEAVVASDGLVVVSPVFNASFSGLFKLFFDVLHEGALLDKPVLLGATGGSSRHSLVVDQAMLPLFFYLKAAVVPTSVFAATEDWGDASSGLNRRIELAGSQLRQMVLQRIGSPVEVTDAETGSGAQAQRDGAAQADDQVDRPASNGRTSQSATAGDFTITRTLEEMLGDI